MEPELREKAALYSERQVLLATVLGTPVAGSWLLRSNLRALGRGEEGRQPVLLAIAATAMDGGLAFLAAGSTFRAKPLIELSWVGILHLSWSWWMGGVERGAPARPWWHAVAAGITGGLLVLLWLFLAVLIWVSTGHR